MPTALLDFARGVNATQLVLGTSRRSRLARLFDEGIGAAVVRGPGPIDVHMVTHDEAGGGLRAGLARSPLRRQAAVRRLGARAARCPALATAGRLLLREQLTCSTDVSLFLATVLVALVGGLGPALFAAAARRRCCSTSSSRRRCTRSPRRRRRT